MFKSLTIWKARNYYVFKGVKLNPFKSLYQIRNLMLLFVPDLRKVKEISIGKTPSLSMIIRKYVVFIFSR